MVDQIELSEEEIEKRRNARVFCFVDDEIVHGFERAQMKMLNELNKLRTSIYINDNNALAYSHGSKWVHTAQEGETEAQLQTFSAELIIPNQSIVENDLGLISRVLVTISESMSNQLATSILSVVGAAAEQAGNVVSDKETGSTAQSFLEALRMIEFGVDKEGNVSLPQWIVGPDMADKLVNELQSQPPEYLEEVKQLTAERSELALRKEAERKSKFRIPK
jgi:hypothetical protein